MSNIFLARFFYNLDKKLMATIIHFMKTNYKILLALIILSASLFAFNGKAKKTGDPEKDKQLLELLSVVIAQAHYAPHPLDDEFSKGIFKDFVKALDPYKRYFLQSDYEDFLKYETEIDDEIKNKDLTFFDLSYNRYLQRVEESKKYYKEILSKPIDYTLNESFDTDYDKHDFQKSTTALMDLWRKQIKLSALASLTDKIKMQDDLKNGVVPEKAKNIKKNQIKAAADSVPKTYDQLEKEVRESAMKSQDDYFAAIKEFDREDWFAVFLNTIAERYDPHTSYFAPEAKEKFNASISGKFFGIGARLQKKNDFTEITELISGGPAWREKELEPGDIILKVGQGSAEPVDIVGMKLDEVVKKIKGPKGTEVRLTVKKATDASIKIIIIMRDEVELEETYAKSSTVEMDGKLYGVIYLPKFYIDFDDKNSRDAAKDIAIEVARLKKQGVQGIALDLRDNGGGSLRTVVDIAGLFIEKGPVVQVKTVGKKAEVLSDMDPQIQWDGPLVIMINNFSASASEILAAAMQDYKRAIIIGSKQSFGKGTVQNVINLNQYMRNSSLGDMGALKTTTQKFYRINGGSTQLKGVSSDVEMPDRYSYIDIGERDMDGAMAWDMIDPANYSQWEQNTDFEIALQNSKKRIQVSEQFKLIEENAKWLNKRKDDNIYSLNIDKFKKEIAAIESESKKYKAISDYKNTLTFKSLPDELLQIEKDSVLKEKRVRWHESLSKDAYVEEALRVLGDLRTKKVALKN